MLPKRRKILEQPLVNHKYTEGVAKKVQSWRWPKGAGRTVWVAVNDSLLAYTSWVERMNTLEVQCPRLSRFHKHLIEIIPKPQEAIEGWFREVFKKLSWRRDFSGDLSQYLWKVGHPLWTSKGREWAEEWCNNYKLWDDLIGALSNEN